VLAAEVSAHCRAYLGSAYLGSAYNVVPMLVVVEPSDYLFKRER
jgi:hypothetical protein